MTNTCTWPSGTCQHWIKDQSLPDPFGRVWMHCESGLTMSNASLARFLSYCLKNNVEIGSISAFQPSYPRSLVLASIRIKPELIEDFQKQTGGILREPPRISLN